MSEAITDISSLQGNPREASPDGGVLEDLPYAIVRRKRGGVRFPPSAVERLLSAWSFERISSSRDEQRLPRAARPARARKTP